MEEALALKEVGRQLRAVLQQPLARTADLRRKRKRRHPIYLHNKDDQALQTQRNNPSLSSTCQCVVLTQIFTIIFLQTPL